MVVANQQAAAPPRIVGRYALFDEIAAGGMATIHLGRLVGPVGFSRTVAIKTLHPQFGKDPEFVEMFLEEARLASRIQHPNVISTLDVATTEGEVFLVMEYVAGESLAKLVRSALKKGERVPVEIAASVLSGMLHGLHATHEAKNEQLEPMHIVHRDVSPQNVLVGLDGVARIFDFGVAKAAAMRSQSTSDGQMKGKLSYMSPEQLNSRNVDRRTDVFAAGVVAWECLTGRRLFSGSDPGEVLAKVLTLDVRPPIDVLATIPRALSDAVMRALERSPEQRWQTARDFAIELERNSPLAAPHIVGDWVERNASDAVQDRRHRVEMVERASVELGHLSVSGTIVGLPSGVPAPDRTPATADAHALDTSDFAKAGSGTSRSSNLTVSSSAATKQPGAQRRWGLWVSLCAFGAAAAVALWYWQQGGFEQLLDATPRAVSLPEPPGEPSPSGNSTSGNATSDTPSRERSGVHGSGGAEGSVPPVLEIASLPEQAADQPDAGAGPDPAPGSELEHAGDPALSHSGSSTHRVRRAGKRGIGKGAREEPVLVPAENTAAGAASASSGSPSLVGGQITGQLTRRRPTGGQITGSQITGSQLTGSKLTTGGKPAENAQAKPAAPPTTPNKSECDPPWYIDAKGIQKIKPVCL
ncbi:MAG: serine/threonine-protein kinase [Deltaproteobacteria bacterium]